MEGSLLFGGCKWQQVKWFGNCGALNVPFKDWTWIGRMISMKDCGGGGRWRGIFIAEYNKE